MESQKIDIKIEPNPPAASAANPSSSAKPEMKAAASSTPFAADTPRTQAAPAAPSSIPSTYLKNLFATGTTTNGRLPVKKILLFGGVALGAWYFYHSVQEHRKVAAQANVPHHKRGAMGETGLSDKGIP